jgi:hypothetical protein
MGGVESGKNSLHCPVGRPASGGRFGSAVAGRMKNEYGIYLGKNLFWRNGGRGERERRRKNHNLSMVPQP